MIMHATLRLTLPNGRTIDHNGFYNDPPRIVKPFKFHSDEFGLIDTEKIRHMCSEPPHGHLHFHTATADYGLIFNE